MIANSIILVLISAPLIMGKGKPETLTDTYEKPENDGVVFEDIPIAKPQTQLPTTEPNTKPKVKTVVYAKPKVVKDNTETEGKDLANIDELEGAKFGTEQIEGEPIKPSDISFDSPEGLDNGISGAENNEPFIYVEEMPAFVGGEREMLLYIGKKLKYPAEAQRIGAEGIVVVSFVVTQTGKISNAEIVKGIGYGADEEALRVIENMPYWRPGKQNGKPVAVRFTLPIRFSLK